MPPFGRAVLQVPRPERTSASQFADHVAHEGVVGLEPVSHVLPAFPGPVGIPPHRDPVDREVGRGHDVRPVLEERPIAPQQPFELRDAEASTEPAEQDELLRPGDRRGRVDLDLAQVSHGVLDRTGSRCVEELAHHGEVPRLPSRNQDGLGHRRRRGIWGTCGIAAGGYRPTPTGSGRTVLPPRPYTHGVPC